MSLRDFLAAWMLGRHAHITLTCHLLAAHLLWVAHPSIRDQTVRTWHPKEQQEYGCCYDLVNELHLVSIIDAFAKFDSAAWERLHAFGKKIADHRWPHQRKCRYSSAPMRTRVASDKAICTPSIRILFGLSRLWRHREAGTIAEMAYLHQNH
jgi:hypothetical protein